MKRFFWILVTGLALSFAGPASTPAAAAHSVKNGPGDNQPLSMEDPLPPDVNWVSPVPGGEVYSVSEGSVLLEAEASDDFGINRVYFSRWDPVDGHYVQIAIDYEAPYNVDLDVSTLRDGFNQVFARAYDVGGNASPSEYIWLERVPPGDPPFPFDMKDRVYLPFIVRVGQ